MFVQQSRYSGHFRFCGQDKTIRDTKRIELAKFQIQEQEKQEKLQLEKERLDLEKALKQHELDVKLQMQQ